MEGFNNKIQVNQLAMIIRTRMPEYSYLIGQVVMVEAITHTGGLIPDQFVDKNKYDEIDSKVEGAVASLAGFKMNGIVEGYMHIAQKNLMPLPPLDEKELAKDKELELA